MDGKIAVKIKNPCVAPSMSFVMLERGQVITLGRGSTSNVIIPNPYLSRKHIKLSWLEETALVHDLESTNGTHVNNLRVVGTKELSVGDCIMICDVTLIICKPDDPEITQLQNHMQCSLNAQIEGSSDIQAKLQENSLEGRKTRVIKASSLRNVGLGMSRAETLTYPLVHSVRQYVVMLVLLAVIVGMLIFVFQ